MSDDIRRLAGDLSARMTALSEQFPKSDAMRDTMLNYGKLMFALVQAGVITSTPEALIRLQELDCARYTDGSK